MFPEDLSKHPVLSLKASLGLRHMEGEVII